MVGWFMKNNMERKLATLEEKNEPRLISTLADFVLWCAKHEDGDDKEIELSPQMQELVEDCQAGSPP